LNCLTFDALKIISSLPATAAMDKCDTFIQNPLTRGRGKKTNLEAVTIMHYLMPDGSIVLNFEHASTMLNILTIFMAAVSDQLHLHENYLCLHPQLPPDYFVGALLLEDLVAASITPLFGLILSHFEVSCHWHTRPVIIVFTYLIFCCLVPRTIS
jgi:hypothetical protein